MGSPLGPVLANIFMAKLERTTLKEEIEKCRFYCRYIDDIFIIHDGDITSMLQSFNSGHPAISFTSEVEVDGKIPFLDVLLSRCSNGFLQRRLYRKPTWTGQYLNFISAVPLQRKRNLVKTLMNRAHKICSEEFLASELLFIKETLLQNGYPERFITKNMLPTNPRPNEDSTNNKKLFIQLPFVNDLGSEIITRRLKAATHRTFKEVNLRVSFRTRPLIVQKLKDNLPEQATSMCLYQFQCSCSAGYIGQTSRQLSKRIKEHLPRWFLRGELKKINSAILAHLIDNDHQVDATKAFRVIYRVPPNKFKQVRRNCLSTAEAIAINLFNPILCRQKQLTNNILLPWPYRAGIFKEKLARFKYSSVNGGQSSFDERTDSWSAVQYFQFYSYLSQQQNMMQDYIRTASYQRAILENSAIDFRGKVVLDVGAGSGILSFFAIQAGATKVYAVEASNMATHCNTLVQSNKLAGRIIVLSGKIEEISLPEQVDVIISEPMGYMLYNERMLETYVYARKFLKPHLKASSQPSGGDSKNIDGDDDQTNKMDVKVGGGEEEDSLPNTDSGGKTGSSEQDKALPNPGVMFPSVANLYVVPFSDEALFLEQLGKANFWYQQSFHGMDLTALRNAALAEYFNQPIVDTFDIAQCPALPNVHKVDFRTVDQASLTSIDIPLHFQLTSCSTIHGLAFWFDVGFLGTQRDVWLSTAPVEPLTHWYQVRCLLGTPLFVQEGQSLDGFVTMRANTRQSYDVKIEITIPGTQTKISNTLDLKNPHFRYNGYPPAPPPGSHQKPPTETYYTNLCLQQLQQQTQFGQQQQPQQQVIVQQQPMIQQQSQPQQTGMMTTAANASQMPATQIPTGFQPVPMTNDNAATAMLQQSQFDLQLLTPSSMGSTVVPNSGGGGNHIAAVSVANNHF